MSRTRFAAGGLRVSTQEQLAMPLASPRAFTAPASLNHSGYCLPTSDQGNTSACASFTMCGWAECHDWRSTHVPKQHPAQKVYERALLDTGLPADSGLTFTQALEAAQGEGVISNKYKLQPVLGGNIRFAFHQYGLVLFGFNVGTNWNRTSRWSGKIDKMRSRDQILGGHAVLGTGYNGYGPWFQNSWLPWGKEGFGQMGWKQMSAELIVAFVLVHK